MSRQPHIDSVMWLLLIISLMQVYNKEEQVGQKEIQNVQFGEEQDIDGLTVTAKACAGREATTVMKTNAFEEGPNLHWNTGRVSLGQDPTCERERPKECSALRKKQQTNAAAEVL